MWQWTKPGTTVHDVLRAEQALQGRTHMVTSLLDARLTPLPLEALLEPNETYTIAAQPDEAIIPRGPSRSRCNGSRNSAPTKQSQACASSSLPGP